MEKGKEIEEQSRVIEIEKREAEEALTDALPALEAARLALDDLDKTDVSEIRSGLVAVASFRKKCSSLLKFSLVGCQD